MKIKDVEVKEGLLYKDNMWIRIDGNTATVGMTDAAAKRAKDIAFIELPNPDDAVALGKPFGNIESAKWAGEMVAPLSGKIKEVNSGLESSPDLINKDPFGKGWIIKIDMDDKKEAEGFLDHASYAKKLEKEL